MKIMWNGRDVTGRFRMEATPEAYDGVPPIDVLLMDRDMPQVNNDLLGISSVLAFGEYCEGRLELPRTVSPEAASAIEEFLEPARVRVSDVEYEPFANSLGEGYLYLDLEGILQIPAPNILGTERVAAVSVLNSAAFSGALASMDGVALGSNAAVLGKLCQSESSFLPSLAVAVLFAESLRARTIVVEDPLISDSGFRTKLSNLLGGCKLMLINKTEFIAIRDDLVYRKALSN